MNKSTSIQKPQEGPNYREAGRLLALGCLRRLGYLPIPREVQERLEREGKKTTSAS